MDTSQLELPYASRLAAVQRLYIYLVTLVSFVASFIAVDRLVLVLDQVWLGHTEFPAVYAGPFLRDAVAGRGGVLVVATPIFLVHWHLAQRRQDQPSFRNSALRKLFFYVAMALCVGYALVYASQMLYDATQLALGAPLATVDIWPSGWFYRLFVIVVAVVLQAFLLHVIRHDGDYGQETGWGGTVRRAYQTLAGLIGVCLLIVGVSDVLETLWMSMASAGTTAGAGWYRSPISTGIALLVVGVLLTRYNWYRWQAIMRQAPDEATTFLRRLYLYGAVVIAAVATLVPAANLLRELLLRTFDPANADWSDLIGQTASPVSLIPAGLAIWIWFARHIQSEARAFGESTEAAAVRRIYYYAVAATGIVLLWFGASAVIQALVDWSATVATERLWAEPLATGLSLLAVGAPIWSFHWRSTQTTARLATATGAVERASLPRRIYLYAVALAGALLILFYLARVAYRIFLLLLGDPAAAFLSTETAEEIARAAIAALFWTVHLLAIRGDARFAEEMEQPASDHDTVDRQRQRILQRISSLELELASARRELAQLDPPLHSQPD